MPTRKISIRVHRLESDSIRTRIESGGVTACLFESMVSSPHALSVETSPLRVRLESDSSPTRVASSPTTMPKRVPQAGFERSTSRKSRTHGPTPQQLSCKSRCEYSRLFCWCFCSLKLTRDQLESDSSPTRVGLEFTRVESTNSSPTRS